MAPWQSQYMPPLSKGLYARSNRAGATSTPVG